MTVRNRAMCPPPSWCGACRVPNGASELGDDLEPPEALVGQEELADGRGPVVVPQQQAQPAGLASRAEPDGGRGPASPLGLLRASPVDAGEEADSPVGPLEPLTVGAEPHGPGIVDLLVEHAQRRLVPGVRPKDPRPTAVEASA